MSDQPDKVVYISRGEDGVPFPDQDPIVVKKGSQKIRFCANFNFQITIDGFNDVTHGTGNPGCYWRAMTGYFNTETRYKYSITADGKTNDPDIDVKP